MPLLSGAAWAVLGKKAEVTKAGATDVGWVEWDVDAGVEGAGSWMERHRWVSMGKG